jgi:hypothetical protein
MIPCGPLQTNLSRFHRKSAPKFSLNLTHSLTPSFAIKLTAITFLATFAFAQTAPKYDATTETTLKVAVEQLKLVPPTGGKPIAYLVAKSATDEVQIFLCPKSFLDEMGMEFKAGEEIQVVGSKVKQDGADLILAREVVKGGDTLTLRFKDGKPAW